MKKYRLLATTAFGVEGITKREVSRLGFNDIEVENGKVFFTTDEEGLCKANLWLRTASKVYWVIDSFKSTSFSDLYDSIYKLPWHRIMNQHSKIIVQGKSVKSELYSLSSIQSISKKAIVDALMDRLHCDTLPEDKESYEVLIDILKDKVTVRINTTGEGLFKRGYRLENNDAPLRETLASTLVNISRWKAKIPLIDPMCGTGTILIEAALYGLNIAPGLHRQFAFQTWPIMSEKTMAKARIDARNQQVDRDMVIKGFDRDPEVIEVAKANAERAGVSEYISFECRDLKHFETDITYGYMITNPPYGERLGTLDEAKYINQLLGKYHKDQLKTWSMYIFTAYDDFEYAFDEKATKNRKLYNGQLKCYFYQYYGPRPPKNRL